MRIRPAQPADEQAIRQLLQARSLPTSDLVSEALAQFFVAEDEAGAPVGVVGLEIEGEVALLRSLAVVRSVQGSGLGRRLTEAAESLARARGVRALYLLTMTAGRFFDGLGYRVADRAAAPTFIRNTAQFRDLCPAPSTLMEKNL